MAARIALLPIKSKYSFYINDKDLGAVAVKGVESPLMGTLSAAQVNALLKQASQKTKISFKIRITFGIFPMQV